MPVRLKRDIHSGNRMERGMEKSAEAVVVRERDNRQGRFPGVRDRAVARTKGRIF